MLIYVCAQLPLGDFLQERSAYRMWWLLRPPSLRCALLPSLQQRTRARSGAEARRYARRCGACEGLLACSCVPAPAAWLWRWGACSVLGAFGMCERAPCSRSQLTRRAAALYLARPLLPPLLPRAYTIASSARLVGQTRVQLAVSVVSVPTPDGGMFNGLCSKSGGRDSTGNIATCNIATSQHATSQHAQPTLLQERRP
jgi:hypothetical protein